MRKILLSIAVLGGIAAGTAGAASAAPVALPGPVVDQAQVQTVQYGPEWRARRDYWRARRMERWASAPDVARAPLWSLRRLPSLLDGGTRAGWICPPCSSRFGHTVASYRRVHRRDSPAAGPCLAAFVGGQPG